MLKWLFDRTVSLIGIVVLSPMLFITAIIIKLKMPEGPVIFKQNRVGRHGRIFTMYKFRTMTVINQGFVSVAAAETNRITPLGKKLRKYKLDELPELWNVLRGDMSFVGPRPDVPGYADKLTGKNRDILMLRPGITGPASLKYRNEEELLAAVDNPIEYNDNVIYPDKVRLNLYYKNHYSFFKDLQIIFCTILGKKMKYAGEII